MSYDKKCLKGLTEFRYLIQPSDAVWRTGLLSSAKACFSLDLRWTGTGWTWWCCHACRPPRPRRVYSPGYILQDR